MTQGQFLIRKQQFCLFVFLIKGFKILALHLHFLYLRQMRNNSVSWMYRCMINPPKIKLNKNSYVQE